MKKIRKIALLFFILPVSATTVWSQTVVAETVREENELAVRLALQEVDSALVLDSLGEGFSCRIKFDLEIYLKQGGFFNLFGGNLKASRRAESVARYDRFFSVYRISTESGEQTFDNSDDFLEHFFIILFTGLEEAFTEKGEYEIRTRIRLYPVLQSPPLNIVFPSLIDNVLSTGWQKFPLETTG